MEERDKLTARRVDARQVRPLVGVTAVTGQGKIIRVIRPMVLLGDDVFEVMPEASLFLAEQTVFTAVPGTLAGKLSRGGIHQEESFKPR
jgi:hypothetical protein